MKPQKVPPCAKPRILCNMIGRAPCVDDRRARQKYLRPGIFHLYGGRDACADVDYLWLSERSRQRIISRSSFGTDRFTGFRSANVE